MLKKNFSLLLALLVVMLNISNAISKNFNLTEFKESLPELLGANNSGKEFWLTFNPCWETDSIKNYLKLYISSPVATLVTVEVPGKGVFMQQMTVPNDIIEFNLTPDEGQCYRKTDRQAPMAKTLFKGYGIHVYSDYPIICYGVTRYMYTSDGYLAIPVSSLGKEYKVASWADISDFGIQYLPSYTAIIAAFDQTDVSFTLGGTFGTMTNDGLKPGDTKTVSLNKGDVYLISGGSVRADLTGSNISSTKPVSVISSNFCAYVPELTGFCDFLTEMEIPTMAWGKEYHYTPIYGRMKNSMIKIISKEPNTTLYRDNIPMVQLNTGGGLEGNGWIKMRADINAPRPIVFSGDKPIYIAQFNTGQMDDNIPSDPFQTVLTPIEQYQREIIFNTPGIKNGLKFNENYVNIVYPSTDGSIPDDLLFAQVTDGNFTWKKVSELDFIKRTLSYAVPINGMNYNVTSLILPGDGVYKIKSNDFIAAYAYGFSAYDSYGFPASAVIADLNKADPDPPDPKFTVYGNGTIAGGTVEDMPRSQDRSNLSMIVFHPDQSENYDFRYNEFIPGDDANTGWSASVLNKNEDARLVATFSDRRGNDTTIEVGYYAPKYAFASDIDLGELRIGNKVNAEITISNKSNQPETFTDTIIFKYGNKGFGFTETPLLVFVPGSPRVAGIKFDASEAGEFVDSVGFWRGGTEDEFFIEVRAKVTKSTSVDFGNEKSIEVIYSSDDNWIYIKSKDESKKLLSIKLFDIFGNVVYENENINVNLMKINTSGLANGLYFIQIGTERVSIFKVMVSR